MAHPVAYDEQSQPLGGALFLLGANMMKMHLE